MRGFYVVAVHGLSDVHFGLEWRHSNNQIQRASFSTPKTVNLPPNGTIFATLFNFYNEDLELVVMNKRQPVEVYWTTLPNSQSFFNGADLKHFPTRDTAKLVLTAGSSSSINNLIISKANPGFCYLCKHLITFKNLNEHEPVQIQYKFNVKSSGFQFPEQLNPSTLTFGATTAGEVRRYMFHGGLLQDQPIHEYNIEVHMIHG